MKKNKNKNKKGKNNRGNSAPKPVTERKFHELPESVEYAEGMNVQDIAEFLKVIDSCEGKVELITDDGDRLNLKSKLCQLVSLSTIFSSAAKIPEMEIIAHELEDSKKIMDYLMRG